MKPTLKDIAEQTGLSISTVSRILRGDSNSSKDNVEQTIHVAQRLNYPINSRLLNQQYEYKSTLQVALISSFYPDEFYSAFFYGINNAAKAENINMSYHIYTPEDENLHSLINSLSHNFIDAAILFIPTLQESDYKEIIENVPESFPLVSLAPAFNPVIDTMTFDSYRGGHLVAKHFYDRGYKDMGIITGPHTKNEAIFRKNGFTDFINQKEDATLVWQVEGDYTFGFGKRAYQSYAKLDKKPRAIFTSNDYMCLGFLEQATRNGVNIPGDVAVAGFDDLPACEYVHPGITSVHTDYDILGKKAFKLLNDKITPPHEHSGILSVVPVTLTVRESS
ncbi:MULTISPECIES: LacI family DNA-binding transcriptional regulator [Gracilimonas]|uniref:LacI family transcriptional regulator n=1 Tax=Gracilimonas sediminicola TaxID=2952158 RepID=A0A9X2L662_9BACT|nr:LacI family DNA-binding transcriptional regulator [Gracilimonas sediminicola]MCP9292985.1 LacI family transcriptional regulator [Gracilimonas sediminicola]